MVMRNRATNSEPVLASSETALCLQDVERSFGSNKALRGITLSVSAGERLALLGPNGAGKTSLVRAICGRLRIDRGEIKIFGDSIERPKVLDQLGVVPQDLAIYGDLTTQENLTVFGRLHGLKGYALKDRVGWALKWVGLEDRKTQLTKTFSGGMKRRVNIACGVLHSPRIVLLDEPSVGVDPQSRQRIFDMLDELNEFGTTIVLTTHHLEEAQTQCDRIVIIDHGQVIADGTLAGLIEHTTGTQRKVYLSIDGELTSSVPNLDWDETNACFVSEMDDPAIELPHLLQRIRGCGGDVVDLEMHQPNLHDVFIHLTGHGLRE
jgi:ABC-2 type transport system ATP-binding protein